MTKLRAGDIIAGTWVIHAPKTKLMADISSSVPTQETGRFVYTPEQLDAYGIHELHVLEDVLRKSTDEVKISVTTRIQEKIGWTPEPGESRRTFLETYYAALRRHLEQKMLFGKKKADKYDQS